MAELKTLRSCVDKLTLQVLISIAMGTASTALSEIAEESLSPVMAELYLLSKKNSY